jgi:imidazole glycerol-phosphate synthase subunit HisH
MTSVHLIDIGGGNTGSVKRCLQLLDIDFDVCDLTKPPSGDRPVVLPGVGAFGPVMEHLQTSGFDRRLKDLVRSGTPYLGICVGMQILFEASQEAEGVPGLGLVAGTVRKFTEGKVPQIGWNYIELVEKGAGAGQTDSAIRKRDFPEGGYVYFVNSYYPQPASMDVWLYSCNYYVTFCAAVRSANITAFQFHPEKSGAFGKTLLKRWVESVAQ